MQSRAQTHDASELGKLRHHIARDLSKVPSPVHRDYSQDMQARHIWLWPPSETNDSFIWSVQFSLVGHTHPTRE